MEDGGRGCWAEPRDSDLPWAARRDPQFSATPVLASDVIHAQSKDLPRIFRVSVGQMVGTSLRGLLCTSIPDRSPRQELPALLSSLRLL